MFTWSPSKSPCGDRMTNPHPQPIRGLVATMVSTLAILGLAGHGLAGEAGTQEGGVGGPLPSDEVTRANVFAAAGHREEAIALLELHVSANPKDALAKQTLLSLRIATMEEEIRTILGEQAKARELVIGDPDYESARSRADAAVSKRLDIAEFYAHNRRFVEAAMVCNAILKDYPLHPAALKLKFRILTEMVARERIELLKDRALRRDDAINDVADDAIMPGELPKAKRTIFVFDEDIADVERSALQKRMQHRLDLIYDGTTPGTKSAQVREALQVLFAVAGINYVILDSALGTETLTLHLVNETIETALATISKLVNIRYNYSGGTVYISSATSDVMVTEIIRVHSGLTDVETEPKLGGNEIASGGGGQGGANGGQPQAGGAGLFGGGGGGGGGQQGGGNQPFVSDLERFLDKVPDIVVGWPAEGKIYLEKKSNTVYVRSTPSTILEVKRLLQALDYNTTQVLIEARFIEVTDTGAKELGVDWAGGGKGGDAYVSAPTTNFTLPNPATDAGATILTGAQAAGATGGGLLAQLLVKPSDYLQFKATISALETSGKADTLSEPKILTLNNSIGIIEVKQDISYISGYTNAGYNNTPETTGFPNNPNGGFNTGNNYSTASLVPQFTKDSSGIELRIRPSVARNSDIITLSIMPSVRELVRAPEPITFNNSNGSGGGDPVTNTIERPPDFDTRRLVTALHVQNGGTVVLGGLSKEKIQESRTGLPFMSRIPVVGGLFRRDSKSTERRNLMIFVTAHIIDPHGAKQGEEIQRLRDTARVLLPSVIDTATKNSAAEAAKPDPAAKQDEDAGPLWRRERRR
jgi:type II secretory pathway component GspD/PulD (secretin)